MQDMHYVLTFTVLLLLSACASPQQVQQERPSSWGDAAAKCVATRSLTPAMCKCVYNDLAANMSFEHYLLLLASPNRNTARWYTADQQNKRSLASEASNMAMSNDELTRQVGYALKGCLARN